MKLYQYPNKAKVDKVIPKNKFYQQGQATNKITQGFVNCIDKVIWAYKLSSDTIHIDCNDDLQEIQIFHIESRQKDIDISLLEFIDKLILTPIIFEIYFGGKVKIIATYKRLNNVDKSKVVLDKYYQSEWLDDEVRQDLPIFLNISDLYNHFIEQLLPHHNTIQNKEYPLSITEKLVKAKQREAIHKQIDKIRKQILSEKQFNKKVILNMELHKLQTDLNNL
ncbi:DUF4391 domain-containing protein [Actinobacillus delphinicola]|uniref:DUF4391 domain-containing protein n=1 Tax=Actinobacillus delphinicola TaxID=51161 RepID=A0A448TVM6_9PAST|nr:DUF4391 domain-containing protein [Actinobacillus delphinicola]VEJ09985.1 Uncharacterised protein [Actinobacillus delphinicola]